MTKRKSGAHVQVPDGTGRMRAVTDHRFETDPWHVQASVPASQAETWMAHLNAEVAGRGWSSSGLTQLNAEDNSGSLTIYLINGQEGPTIEIAWEKARGERLEVRGRPGGHHVGTSLVVEEFFTALDTRCRAGQTDCAHRRHWLTYEGLPWLGELWLSDTLRLGPPSRYPSDALLGRQAVLVDARVHGIGFVGITANFHALLRELRLVLSPILGINLENRQRANEWVPEIDEERRIVDCRIRPVGYTESGPMPEWPTRGCAPAVTREEVARPGLGRFGIWPDDRSQRVPEDIGQLWASFSALTEERREQFLNACNAYSVARSMWPGQRTAYAVFLVVACEALKPSGKKYDKANLYDVVAALIDLPTSEALRALRLSPQRIRNQHVHRGVLVADELTSLLAGDPFRDPSFDETLTLLSRIARMCLIEWLRHRGEYQMLTQLGISK